MLLTVHGIQPCAGVARSDRRASQRYGWRSPALAAGAAGFIWAATSALSSAVLPTAGLWLQALVTACALSGAGDPARRGRNRGDRRAEQA